jgi:hypothetical protein
MARFAFYALVAPSLASAAAFPWALPEPTFVVPEIDAWSPAPTQAPGVGGLELFRRAPEGEVCGYLSGISSVCQPQYQATHDELTDILLDSALTCHNSGDSCATNTYYGAHGCCPSGSLSACTIPTSCIPSSLMSASCTDKKCSSDGFIAKCTASEAPECYEHLYVYSTARVTTLTEFGCAAAATTAIIERTYSGYIDPNASTEASVSTKTTTETASPTSSLDPTRLSATQGDSKSNNTPAIIGGTIGGLVVVGAIITLIIFLILRDRKQKREAATHQSWVSNQSGPAPGVTEYNPNGFVPASPWMEESKGWKPASPDCGMEGGFVGMRANDATLFGVVETAGREVVEAPG